MTDDATSGTARAMTTRFIDALGRLESEGDADALVALYAPDAVAGNVVKPDAGQGEQGVRHFWEQYRSSFDEIRSTFRNEVEGDGAAALEWQSEGSMKGNPLRYAGVTVLEFGEGGITRSCAYFDPTALADKAL